MEFNLPTPERPPKPYDKNSYLDEIQRENQILDQELEDLLLEENEADAIQEYSLTPTERLHKDMSDLEQQLKEHFNESPLQKGIPAHNCAWKNFKQQQNDKEGEGIGSLKKRLKGQQIGVKELEASIQEKDITIAQLIAEIERKDLLLDELNISDIQTPKRAPSQNISSQHRKQNEIEKQVLIRKIQQCEKELADEKKTTQRLQELNKKLMSRVREQEQYLKEIGIEKQFLMEANDQLKQVQIEKAQLGNFAKQLQARVQELEQQIELQDYKYQQLFNSSVEFEAKTRELYKVNQILNENLIKLIKD